MSHDVSIRQQPFDVRIRTSKRAIVARFLYVDSRRMRRLKGLNRTAVSLISAFTAGAPAVVLAAGYQTLDTVEVIGQRDGLVGTADSANQGTVTREQLENRPILRP